MLVNLILIYFETDFNLTLSHQLPTFKRLNTTIYNLVDKTEETEQCIRILCNWKLNIHKCGISYEYLHAYLNQVDKSKDFFFFFKSLFLIIRRIQESNKQIFSKNLTIDNVLFLLRWFKNTFFWQIFSWQNYIQVFWLKHIFHCISINLFNLLFLPFYSNRNYVWQL